MRSLQHFSYNKLLLKIVALNTSSTIILTNFSLKNWISISAQEKTSSGTRTRVGFSLQ